MAVFSSLLLVLCFFYSTVFADDEYLLIPSRRAAANRTVVNALSNHRRKASAILDNDLGTSLYWFGDFSVGESANLSLLVDTGSTDLILNNGLYQPSPNVLKYRGHKKFSITYEGVNRAGFGFETINGTLTRDNVTAGGLTVPHQAVGNATSYKYFDVPQLGYANPGQGIIGFASKASSSFIPQANAWVYNLCHLKLLKQCKFALAFGTSGVGHTVVGTRANSLIDGPMVTLPGAVQPYGPYTVVGDVTIDNKIVEKDQIIIMDVGTDNIQGPIAPTNKILRKLGFQTQAKSEAPTAFDPGVTIKVVHGFFNCSMPPTIGFSFPAQSQLKKGQKAINFNVPTNVWDVFRHGSSDNCTSILGGTNALNYKGNKAWLLGQPFFAGKYIEFSFGRGKKTTVGFANLKNPAG